MIVVRNVFQLKFGKAKEAVALLKEGLAIQQRVLADVDFSTRLLTDVTGRNYSLVLELSLPDLATYEANVPRVFADPDWQGTYSKLTALVDSAHRDVFRVVE